jgi:cytochrome c oxidase subunit 4
VLFALTGVEVALAAAGARGGVMLALLLVMSVCKAWLIIAWFMHLRFERRTLGWALLPAVIVCILLLCFILPDSERSGRIGDPSGSEASHAAETK